VIECEWRLYLARECVLVRVRCMPEQSSACTAKQFIALFPTCLASQQATKRTLMESAGSVAICAIDGCTCIVRYEWQMWNRLNFLSIGICIFELAPVCFWCFLLSSMYCLYLSLYLLHCLILSLSAFLFRFCPSPQVVKGEMDAAQCANNPDRIYHCPDCRARGGQKPVKIPKSARKAAAAIAAASSSSSSSSTSSSASSAQSLSSGAAAARTKSSGASSSSSSIAISPRMYPSAAAGTADIKSRKRKDAALSSSSLSSSTSSSYASLGGASSILMAASSTAAAIAAGNGRLGLGSGLGGATVHGAAGVGGIAGIGGIGGVGAAGAAGGGGSSMAAAAAAAAGMRMQAAAAATQYWGPLFSQQPTQQQQYQPHQSNASKKRYVLTMRKTRETRFDL
jgi:hypothetical protein